MNSNLDLIEKLARASKLKRLLHNPGRYLFGILHRMLVYPFSKKGKPVETTTFFGTKMKVMLPSGMDLFLLGGKTHDSEIRLARFILNMLKEGDTFLDVGAHYGYFSLLASAIVGTKGTVSCVEASSTSFEVLSQNVKDHGNISHYNNAISNKKEILNFYEYPLIYSEYNSLDADQYDKANWAKNIKPKVNKIEAYPLDEFVQEKKINPDFIKIDVEGVEDKVVQGMKDILNSDKAPIIAMEYILDDNPDSPHELAMRSIIDHGYQCNFIEYDGTLKAIELNDVKKILKAAKLDSDNLIFKKK